MGGGVIADGHGIAVDARDRVLVVDRDAHEIVGFNTAGEVVLRLGRRHQPSFGQPFNHPTDVAVAADGEFYVSDGYGNSQVHRFAADGRHLASWGRPGSGRGEFSTPHAIWVDRQGRVLVADRENDRVQVFDRDGHYLAEWRGFYHPMDLWEDGEGNVVVSDQIPRLSLMSPDGQLIGRCRGAINGAHGIWGDRQGGLYLAELPPERLTRLVRLG
jgi:peptidylglycine monooxygenase